MHSLDNPPTQFHPLYVGLCVCVHMIAYALNAFRLSALALFITGHIDALNFQSMGIWQERIIPVHITIL